MLLKILRIPLVAVLTLLYACQPLHQEAIPPVLGPATYQQKVQVQNSAPALQALQSLQAYYGISTKPGAALPMRLPQGLLYPEQAVVAAHNGQTVFTFKMAEPDSTAAYRLRNVVLQQVNGGYQGYLISFESHAGPVLFNAPAAPFAGFKGTIKWYTLNGKLLAIQQVGQEVAPHNHRPGATQRSVQANQCFEVLEAGWQAFDGSPCQPVLADDDGCTLIMELLPVPCAEGGAENPAAAPGSGGSPAAGGAGPEGSPGGSPAGSPGGGSVPPSGTGTPETNPYNPQEGGGTFVPAVGSGGSSGSPAEQPLVATPPTDPLILGVLPELIDPDQLWANYQGDYRQALQMRLDYLKTMGRRPYAEFVEEFLATTPGLKMGDIMVLLEAVDKEYLRLRAEYMIAVFQPVAETLEPFIELALIELFSVAAMSGILNLMQARLGGKLVRAGQILKVTQSRHFQTFIEILKISDDLTDIQLIFDNKVIRADFNDYKTTLRVRGVTEEEVRQLFKRLSHNGKPRRLAFPNGKYVDMVDFGYGNTVSLRNMPSRGGDLVIQFNDHPYTSNKNLLKFREIKFFLK